MKSYTDHRKAIRDRLEELGKTKYWLAQQLSELMSMNMLYAYLGGKATTTEKFEAICKVLGLELVWDAGDGKKATKGK